MGHTGAAVGEDHGEEVLHQVVDAPVALGREAVRDRGVLFARDDVQPVDLGDVAGQVRPGPHVGDVAHQVGDAAGTDAQHLLLPEQPFGQVP